MPLTGATSQIGATCSLDSLSKAGSNCHVGVIRADRLGIGPDPSLVGMPSRPLPLFAADKMPTEQGRGGRLGMHKVATKPPRCPVRDAF